MTRAMYERVRDYFVDAGLTAGYIVQSLMWDDTKKPPDSFIVFRPNGGADIRYDLGSEYHVLVDVIGAKNKRREVSEHVQSIIDYVQNNGIDDCLGLIENMGNVPAPILTEEGRIVFRLQFACTYGE